MTMSVLEGPNETGRLRLNVKRLGRAVSLGASVIDITARFASERENVEKFIRRIYYSSYKASIDVSYPILMSVRDESGKILAATGFRYASQEALFLERYTGGSIEKTLSERYAMAISRSQIVEIGNLASGGEGASIFLFAALSSYLSARGVQYATITGTDFLQRNFKALGLNPKFICGADSSLLSDKERKRWGSYYDTAPRVLAGSVLDSVLHLRNALGVIYEERMPSLYSRLHFRSNV